MLQKQRCMAHACHRAGVCPTLTPTRPDNVVSRPNPNLGRSRGRARQVSRHRAHHTHNKNEAPKCERVVVSNGTPNTIRRQGQVDRDLMLCRFVRAHRVRLRRPVAPSYQRARASHTQARSCWIAALDQSQHTHERAHHNHQTNHGERAGRNAEPLTWTRCVLAAHRLLSVSGNGTSWFVNHN